MPPKKKFELTLLIIDMAAKSNLNFIYDFYGAKVFDEQGDMIQIIIIQSDGVIKKLTSTEEFYSPDQLKLLEKYPTDIKHSDSINWVEAICLSLDIIKSRSEQYAKTLTGTKIILVTDFTKELQNYNDQMQKQILKDLYAYDVFFFIVGPKQCKQTNYKSIKTIEDLRQFSATVEFECAHFSNVEIANQLITKHEKSAYAEYENGVAIVEFLKTHKMPQSWYCDLTIGGSDSISFPVCVYRFIHDAPVAKIVEKNAKLAQFYKTSTEDEVDREDVIEVYDMHNKIIPYSTNEDQFWKGTTKKSFDLLGFGVNLDEISVYIHGDNNAKVFPDQRVEENGSCLLFNTLYDVMVERNAYAIASRVYNNNFNYTLNALIPDREEKCFIMATLPFRDEVEMCYKPNIQNKCTPAIDPKTELSKKINAYMDDLFQDPLLDPHIQRDEIIDLFNKNVIELCLNKSLSTFSKVTNTSAEDDSFMI